jgi:hypothetical protein
MMRNWELILSPVSVSTVQRWAPFVVRRRGDAGPERDVATQVVAVADVLAVAEDLRLGRVLLRPLPFLLEGGVERVRVEVALDVATRAG